MVEQPRTPLDCAHASFFLSQHHHGAPGTQDPFPSPKPRRDHPLYCPTRIDTHRLESTRSYIGRFATVYRRRFFSVYAPHTRRILCTEKVIHIVCCLFQRGDATRIRPTGNDTHGRTPLGLPSPNRNPGDAFSTRVCYEPYGISRPGPRVQVEPRIDVTLY